MLKESVIRLIKHFQKSFEYLKYQSQTVAILQGKMDGSREHLLHLFNITEDDLEFYLNISRSYNLNTTTAADNPRLYCEGQVKEIVTSYRQVHGYLSLIVCLFGSIANVLNIVVLTRKDLTTAPINRILTGIAVADMLVMLEYIPFACYMYLLLPDSVDYSYGGAVFILFHMHFSQVLHTISICLTLTLAIWRYIVLRYPQQGHVVCTDQRCNTAITIAYILPTFMCLPSYFVFSIRSTHVIEDSTVVVLYHLDLSELAKEDNELLYNVNFWVYAVVIKLIPCAILTVISYYLIVVLYRVNLRKQRLRTDVYNIPSDNRTVEKKTCKTEKRTNRTTRMLVAVLLLFLITEFPQGILGLLSGILGRHFFRACYHLFGEIMDILALINSAINFILYCSMSRQFRATFGELFKPKLLAKWAPTQTETQTTYV